jgi:sulfite reductase (ferredoxin)
MGTPTPVEGIKKSSAGLLGTLAEEVSNTETFFTPDATHLIKFHGFYQQDDRDVRKERASKKLPLDYSCMVRASLPGGIVSAGQWLAMDRLAGEVANGSLRITTRQGIQFHFVHKPDLRGLLHTLNSHLVTTLAACGDVVRNVMACPAPLAERGDTSLFSYASDVSRAFKPTTRSYFDLWVDHEHAATTVDPTPEIDPLYGDAYLPRKFKITFAWPGDNCVDLFSHDLGFVPIFAAGTSGQISGWSVVAGGGMGQSHARPGETYPRLASPIGTIPADGLRALSRAVIETFRDSGDRTDRGRARLKYVLDDRGVDWFINEVKSRIEGETELHDIQPLPAWTSDDEHLGWNEQADGKFFLGVHVDSGRVLDVHGETQMRSALARLATDGLVPEFRMTARQDVLLAGVERDSRLAVEEVLRAHKVPLANTFAPVRRLAVACPALPTCGQALAEAERILPAIVDGAQSGLASAGVEDRAVRIHVTGCPNGCARPYTAEIGIVGRTKKTYDIYVGGSAGGDRLNQQLATDVHIDSLPAAFKAIFGRYQTELLPDETVGDWSARVGVEALRDLVPITRKRRTAVTDDDAV